MVGTINSGAARLRRRLRCALDGVLQRGARARNNPGNFSGLVAMVSSKVAIVAGAAAVETRSAISMRAKMLSVAVVCGACVAAKTCWAVATTSAMRVAAAALPSRM